MEQSGGQVIRTSAAIGLLLLLLSGCATIRTTSRAYDTGEVLEPGQMRFTTDSVMFLWVPMPGQVSVSRGFVGGWEGTVGWGIHGFYNENGSSDEVWQGPEVYVTKQLVDYADQLKVSTTLGADVNVVPAVDALIQARLSAGYHPADWFALYANIGGAFVTSSLQMAPIVGLGLGIDGPLILKIGAYITPTQTESRETADVLWPFYYGLQLGWEQRIRDQSE